MLPLCSDGSFLSRCSRPSCIASPILGSSSPSCVLCHSIVGLGLCLCGRVVSLWNSGDGLRWVEGRVTCGVWRLLSTHRQCCGAHFSGVRVVMAVCDDSACLVLSYCVVGCGMAVCAGVRGLVICLPPSLSLFLFLFMLVFGVVRAQLCEHARYPEHHCVSLVLGLSSLLFSSTRLSFIIRLSFCWNGGVCLPCVGVPSWHDGDG